MLILSILVIYIILGILYESFIHPLTILSGLPSAGFGALVTLMLFHLDLNIYGFVGLIMLVGIVKKNAIMMIDFAIDAQRRRKDPLEAIHEGCLLRFRPIMMTTMCGAHGDPAHRARSGRGRSTPAGPRSGGGRRIDGFPAAHALHHPGGLPLPGIVPPMVRACTINAAAVPTGINPAAG